MIARLLGLATETEANRSGTGNWLLGFELASHQAWSCTIRQPAGVRVQIVVNQPVRSGLPAPLSTY